MVVQTILKPGTIILSPDGNLKVIAYESGMYDLESNGRRMLIDEDAVNHIIEERVWAVENSIREPKESIREFKRVN